MTPSDLLRKYRVRVTTRYPELSGVDRAAKGAHVGEYGAKRAFNTPSRRSRGWGVFAGQTGQVPVITVIITVHRFRDSLIQMGERTHADQRKRGNQLLTNGKTASVFHDLSVGSLCAVRALSERAA